MCAFIYLFQVQEREHVSLNMDFQTKLYNLKLEKNFEMNRALFIVLEFVSYTFFSSI